MDLLAFQLELVHLLLLEGYSCRKHRRPSFHDSEGTSTECCRLVKVSEVKMKRGKCCHCSQKGRKIHHTTFACGKCRVCLCKTPCFYNYHKGKQFPFLSNDDILVWCHFSVFIPVVVFIVTVFVFSSVVGVLFLLICGCIPLLVLLRTTRSQEISPTPLWIFVPYNTFSFLRL